MAEQWNENIQWIQNGEPVEASVANRPTAQVWDNVQLAWRILQEHVNNYNNPHKVTAAQLGIDLSGASSLQDLLALVIKDLAGSFVAEGFETSIDKIDEVNSKVVLKLTPGRAYLEGRIIRSEEPLFIDFELNKFPMTVSGEPKSFQTGKQVFQLNERPLGYTTQVLADIVITETVTRGTVSGGMDYLSNTPVIEVLSVTDGVTTYQEGTDWILDGNAINWSPAGNEPAPGSTYQVTYVYRGSLTKGTHYKDGSNLSAGVYYYFVAPVTANGEVQFNSSYVKQIDLKRDGKYVKIYWNAVNGASSYRVYASQNGVDFYLAGETTGTSFEDYGVWDTSSTPNGTNTTDPPASITSLEDRYSRAIVLISDPGIKNNTYLIVNYVWYAPAYALVVLDSNGKLDVIYGAPDRDPVVPSVPGNSIGIAKVYVPGLDPSGVIITDIRTKVAKVNVIQGILDRLNNLEYAFLRRDLENSLYNKDTSPKKGIFADNFGDPDLIDINHPLYSAEYTGDTIEPKRENLKVNNPTVVSTNGAKKLSNDNYVIDYDEVIEIEQDKATRTIDLVSTTFDTTKQPQVFVSGVYSKDKLPIVTQGKRIRVEVTGFEPSNTVIVTIGGVTIGTITTDERGDGTGVFTVPENLLDTSFAQRLANQVSSSMRQMAQSLFNVLRTAERSLWPVRVNRRTSIVSDVTRPWIVSRWWWGWWWGWERRTTFRRVTTTTVQRFGLQEGPPTNLDLSSINVMDLRAEDQTGKFAVQNVMVTTTPITVPISTPTFTSRLETQVSVQEWTVVRRWGWWGGWWWWGDPVAQSFKLDESGMITSVEVRFASAPSDPNQPLFFKLGLVEDGFPSNKILVEKTIPASEIQQAIANNNGWYKITFDTPIYAEKNTYFFFSLGSTAPGFEVYLAKLGDTGVDVNPYPAGTFFYSGDGNTWNSEQKQDVTFRVYTAKFKSASVPDELKGSFPIAAEIDFSSIDGILASVISIEASTKEPEGTSVMFFYSTDDGITWRPVREGVEQKIGSIVDSLKVKAVLVTHSERVCPLLSADDLSVNTFTYANNSTYVSVMTEMLQNSSTIDVFVYAHVPSGQSINVYVSPDDGTNWIPGTLVETNEWDLNRGIYEYRFTVNVDTTAYPDKKYRLRVDMSCDGINPPFIDQVGMVLK